MLSAAVAQVEIQYLRAINHLNSVLQGHVNQVNATLTRQVARLDCAVRGHARPARPPGSNSGSVADVQKAQAELSRATAQVDAKVDQARRQGRIRQDSAFTASFDRQLASVTGRYGKLNATVKSANPYFQATFQNALNAIDGTIAAEAQGAQAAVQGTTSLVDAAIPQAATTGGPGREPGRGRRQSTGQRQPGPASGRPGGPRQASGASIYSTFTPLRAEMAAIASAQLPPVSLAGAGHGTGLMGHGSGTNPASTGPAPGRSPSPGSPAPRGPRARATAMRTASAGPEARAPAAGTTTIAGGGTTTTGSRHHRHRRQRGQRQRHRLRPPAPAGTTGTTTDPGTSHHCRGLTVGRTQRPTTATGS